MLCGIIPSKQSKCRRCLQYETLGGSSALWYFYDADGNPSGIRYKDNSGTVNDY